MDLLGHLPFTPTKGSNMNSERKITRQVTLSDSDVETIKFLADCDQLSKAIRILTNEVKEHREDPSLKLEHKAELTNKDFNDFLREAGEAKTFQGAVEYFAFGVHRAQEESVGKEY